MNSHQQCVTAVIYTHPALEKIQKIEKMYFYCWACEILWDIVHDLRLCPQCHEQGVLSFIDVPNIVELIELRPVEEPEVTNRPIVFFDTGPIEFTQGQTSNFNTCYICLCDIEGKP